MSWDWAPPLITLTLMEIILGIDNVIFVAIVVGKLPPAQQPRARYLGLGLALVLRILLLLSIFWILQLDTLTLVDLNGLGLPVALTPKDLILVAGGLFLIGKATWELHGRMEGDPEKEVEAVGRFAAVIVQIILLDLVFSIDSVITAVGMVPREHVWVMIAAVVIAVGVMIAFAGPVSHFVHRHPTLKVLALAFLILIGAMLVIEGVAHQHDLKGYIYFAMAFALGVELLNMRLRAAAKKKVTLNEPPPVPPDRGRITV